MKKCFYYLFCIILSIFFIIFISCQGTAVLLVEENAKITIQIIWPRLILPETSDIAIFLSNDNMQSYKKAIMFSKDQGSQVVNWTLYPGDYTITVLALQLKSTTSSGLKNYIILTGDVQKINLSACESKNLSITLNYINISCALAFEEGKSFHINDPIPIKFNIQKFNSVLKFSGGKLYLTYFNGFKNVTEYRTIYVSNTQELGNGIFSSIVYPDTSGFPSENLDLSVYAKFTVASDKIAIDFMDYYQINEIKIEISDYNLGHVSDNNSISDLGIIVQ